MPKYEKVEWKPSLTIWKAGVRMKPGYECFHCRSENVNIKHPFGKECRIDLPAKKMLCANQRLKGERTNWVDNMDKVTVHQLLENVHYERVPPEEAG